MIATIAAIAMIGKSVVERMDLSSPQLVEAVRLWTGWEQSMMPSRSDERLVNHFGVETSAKLLPLIKSLELDFYESDARLVAANPAEMERLSSEHFRKRHPTVAEDIVKAFAWCYTFDFK